MSLFGSGRVAATALRGRVLERLGVDPEWTEGDHDDAFICWTAGPTTTFFCVENGPDGAPDLGVFRIFTPVATVGDMAAALERCGALNTYATTNRWMVAPGSSEDADGEMVWIGCSFVVGPLNQRDLESFVTWCVQEQIATATALMTSGLAEQLGGKPCILDHANGRYRDAADWNKVVRHYEDVVQPSNDNSADDLAIGLQTAFLGLRDEMLAEGRGAWYSPEPDSYPLSCEMPANWFGYGEEIRWDPEHPSGPPTARVNASLTTWGDLGNGLLITMWVPGADSGNVNRLNRLDEQARGATHFVGAWAPVKDDAVYLVFLPAALLEQDIAWPVVMREILLTFARQAQLARRVVLDRATQTMLDGGSVQPAGLQAFLKPHGLAWGETGEGRNPVAWHLDEIYRLLVGGDAEWAYPAEHGFRWWPYQQAQEISVVRRDDPAFSEVVRIRVATDVRADVQATPETLIAIAKRNVGLADSALVLRDDGTLVLACQLVVTELQSDGAPEWVQDLAIRQFVTAPELAAELSALGRDAVSAHPVSGPRPEPDWWFGEFAEETRRAVENERDDMPESRPQVALMAAGGQYALPYRMAARDDGGLEFSWRPGHLPDTVPANPEIRVTATPGAVETGLAWISRSHLPVAGDAADKARWCQHRNAELLLAADPPAEPMVFGGWGLTTEAECCLTTGQSRRAVRDSEAEAARTLGYLLREVQMTVLAALRAAPGAVGEVPMTAAELASGLDTVRAAFGRVLGEQPDLAWATEPAATSVLVTCGEIAIEVPVGYGRAQLALVYGQLLVSFPNGRSWLSLYKLFPGATIDLALARLEGEGILWVDEEGRRVFDAGHTRARLETAWVRETRRFGDVQALLVSGIPDDPGIDRFEVTIPPAQYAWAIQPAAVDVLAWVTRRVIGQVREAARPRSSFRKPAPPDRPRPFGGGRFAAAALRARLLELLGAEAEWILGDHDTPDIVWNSGLATTVFGVTDGAAATPDLGVLRIFTPISTAQNGNAARDVCAELNERTATARWSVAREQAADGSYYDEVQVSCAFVVGPHNQDALESFALWCIREQIAVATGHIRSGDVAEAVSGVFCRYTGFPAGDERADWHPVTSFVDRVVLPSASLDADALAGELHAAFRGLRDRMFGERTSAWFCYYDEPPLTCETPFSWASYPGGVITHMRASDDDPDDKPPTALLESELTEHPEFGNGLRITIHVPRDPEGHSGRAVNELNRLDAEVAGASHSIGGWTISKTSASDSTAPGCEVFLPAAFAESVQNRPYVMAEILLTLARQALLARRVLIPLDERSDDDRSQGIGLAVAADPLATFVRGPHGLAWGETGEGRNPAARVLDQIYDNCVGPDAAWADVRTDGFTWWPYRQAQEITATLRSSSDIAQGVSIRIATEVRRRVPVTPGTLRAVAALNAELGQSALALGEDGLLFLACRLYVHEGIDHWTNKWAQILAAEQFITARALSSRLDGSGNFGQEAVSGHPFSGVRAESDELFGIRENTLIGAANGVQAGLTPLVPLLGVCRLYALPLDMSVTDAEGGLDFTWHVSQSRGELPVDAAIRVSVRRGDVGSGPGWIIRSVVPVTGDQVVKALWCNDRNLELLADSDGSGGDRTLIGGWGITPDGGCCLTTWLSPFFIPDAIPQASGLVGSVLSYHAGLVLMAVAADPGAVTEASDLTPEDLTRGLSSVLDAFAGTLEYPADFRWSVVPGTGGAVVTLTGPAAESGQADGVTLAEAGDSGLRTVLQIPLTRNRAQLGLLYGAFLGRSVTRVKTFTDEMIPGEAWGWHFTIRHIEEGLGPLDDEDLLEWHKSELAFTFDAGPAEAWLRFTRLEDFRSYGGTALRLTATIPGLDLSALRENRTGDADVLGSWRADPVGLSYEVTIPPAGMIFGNDFIVDETVTWVGRHIVTHVQQALAGQEQQVNRVAHPDTGWHDRGDGTAAVMDTTELVASFHAQFLVPDEFLKNTPTDRRDETLRRVEEGNATLQTDEEGGERLVNWVARKWQARLDAWWLFGEPVFWCEHIAPDDDEQPLMEWFMRFPAAMACDQCADRIRGPLRAGKWLAACNACGKENIETTYARTPGMSVVANYELCRSCSETFTGRERRNSPSNGEG